MPPMILQANWGRQDVLNPSPVGLFNARNREGLKSDWTLAAHRGRQICARRLSPLPVSKPRRRRLMYTKRSTAPGGRCTDTPPRGVYHAHESQNVDAGRQSGGARL